MARKSNDRITKWGLRRRVAELENQLVAYQEQAVQAREDKKALEVLFQQQKLELKALRRSG